MVWTCNRLDLQTLGFQPVMPGNLPHHWPVNCGCVYNHGLLFFCFLRKDLHLSIPVSAPGLDHIFQSAGPCPTHASFHCSIFLRRTHPRWGGLGPMWLDGLSDHVLSHWVPVRTSSHVQEGRKTGQMRRRGRDSVRYFINNLRYIPYIHLEWLVIFM